MTKIFLTGVTGLVGSAFTTTLLSQNDDYKIVTFARKNAVFNARQRVEDVIREQCAFDGMPENAEKIIAKLEVIEGDVATMDAKAVAAIDSLKGTRLIIN